MLNYVWEYGKQTVLWAGGYLGPFGSHSPFLITSIPECG